MKENKTTVREGRVYVCHTYYHVYVTFLKELNLKKNCQDGSEADIVLSRMSKEIIDADFMERIRNSGVFRQVLLLDERRDSEFPELNKYHVSTGGFAMKMLRRMQLCKKFPQALEQYMDVDFSGYKEVFVYCDLDPIGYYLNYKKIRYHAIEDGLDCNRDFDVVRHFDRKFFGLKCWLAKRGLIFMGNGYSRYAIDMEVNDLSCITYHHRNWKEVPREQLKKGLNEKDREIVFRVFVRDADRLFDQCCGLQGENVLILTQPLCELPVRERIFKDIIEQYGKGAKVLLKPHPRDELDYAEKFPECIVLEKRFPIEVLNFQPKIHFKKVVSVITTAIDAIEFADEKINLGVDFLDIYEAPEVHRYNVK